MRACVSACVRLCVRVGERAGGRRLRAVSASTLTAACPPNNHLASSVVFMSFLDAAGIYH